MTAHGKKKKRTRQRPSSPVYLVPNSFLLLPLLLSLSSHDPSFLFFHFNLPLSSPVSSVVEFSSFISFLYLNICSQMDGKKSNTRSSSTSSATCASEGKKVARKSSHSGLFNSVFPRPMDKKDSSHSEIFGPPRKQEQCLNHAWSNAHKATEGNTSKGYKESSTTTALYGSERSDPCNLSDSLYYGGQDICTESSLTSRSTYDKKDGEDDTAVSSDYASRGNWWQGSLYY